MPRATETSGRPKRRGEAKAHFSSPTQQLFPNLASILNSAKRIAQSSQQALKQSPESIQQSIVQSTSNSSRKSHAHDRVLPLPTTKTILDETSTTLTNDPEDEPEIPEAYLAQAPVEFAIYAPSQAPANQAFDIRINICIYDEDLVEEIEASGVPTFKSLVLYLRKGDLLRLELEEGDIEFDAPRQEIAWNGRDMTVVFVARLPGNARPRDLFGTTLKVSLFELPLGIISFSVVCNKQLEYHPESLKQTWSKKKIRERAVQAKLEGKGFGALRYKTVFISHVTADTDEISYIVDFLKYCGIEVVFAQQDFYSGVSDWKDLARLHLMNKCDSMLLCWSANARQRCKRRRQNPSVRQPSRSVAPE